MLRHRGFSLKRVIGRTVRGDDALKAVNLIFARFTLDTDCGANLVVRHVDAHSLKLPPFRSEYGRSRRYMAGLVEVRSARSV